MPAQHVTQDACDKRHAWTWPTITLAVTIILGLVAAAGLTLSVAYGAAAQSRGLQERHQAQEEFLRDSLTELRTDVRGNRELLTQILRNGGGD